MGFDKVLVEKIYTTIFPANVGEALDYLQKDEKDKPYARVHKKFTL